MSGLCLLLSLGGLLVTGTSSWQNVGRLVESLLRTLGQGQASSVLLKEIYEAFLVYTCCLAALA